MEPISVLRKWFKKHKSPIQMGVAVEYGIPKWIGEKYPCENGLVQSMCIICELGEPVRVYVEYIPKEKNEKM